MKKTIEKKYPGFDSDFSGTTPEERKKIKANELMKKFNQLKKQHQDLVEQFESLKKSSAFKNTGLSQNSKEKKVSSNESKKSSNESKENSNESKKTFSIEAKAYKEDESNPRREVKVKDPYFVLRERLPGGGVESYGAHMSLSDEDVDKKELKVLDLVIERNGIYPLLKEISQQTFVSKIGFLEFKPPVEVSVGIPNAPIPNVPIPNIPKAPLPGQIGGAGVYLDTNLKEIEKNVVLDKQDVLVAGDTLYFGPFVFSKLFMQYLEKSNINKIPASVKDNIDNKKKPRALLRLAKEHFGLQNPFSFKDLDRYLLLDYNYYFFEADPSTKETPSSFATLYQQQLKDYTNFLNIENFDHEFFKDFIKYAIVKIKELIQQQLITFCILAPEIEYRLKYVPNDIYKYQKLILEGQREAANGAPPVPVTRSKPIIEMLFKNPEDAFKDPESLSVTILSKAIQAHKERVRIAVEKKVKRGKMLKNLLRALGFPQEQEKHSMGLEVMCVNLGKKLNKGLEDREIVNDLMSMARVGLKKSDETKLKAEDKDVARLLLECLTEYKETKKQYLEELKIQPLGDVTEQKDRLVFKEGDKESEEMEQKNPFAFATSLRQKKSD
ncbi:MAG: hypothetical protein GY858_06365 [Candidatus Omnitrophica bacterium]|nr:hypothetical protein [Candidatus Omnitrophota bacterium]